MKQKFTLQKKKQKKMRWCSSDAIVISMQKCQSKLTTLIFFYKKPFYKKPRVKSSKITENNKKLFRSITNFLRNLFVVFWHTLRNLTYFCSVFLIFLTYKKSIRNFFDQKLPKSEETFQVITSSQVSYKKKRVQCHPNTP